MRGILIGIDREQHWMLSWFAGNLRRSGCSLPLAIADFGMTPEQRQDAVQYSGSVFAVDAPPSMLTWCAKPKAIIASPFSETLWLDNDCQVLQDPSPVFDELCGDGLGMAPDPYHAYACLWNAGVIVVRNADHVLHCWMDESLSGRHRGDQEALNYIHQVVDGWITHIPQRYNRLRCGGDARPGDVLYHWTGPAGKTEIKRLMANG